MNRTYEFTSADVKAERLPIAGLAKALRMPVVACRANTKQGAGGGPGMSEAQSNSIDPLDPVKRPIRILVYDLP